MHHSNKLAYLNVWQLSVDFLFLTLTFVGAYFAASRFTKLDSITLYLWILILYIPLWISIMGSMGMYNTTNFNYHDRNIRYIFISTAFSGILVAAAMYSLKGVFFSRLYFMFFNMFCLIILVFVRIIVLSIIKNYSGKITKQVLVIGNPILYEKFKNYVDKTSINMTIRGFINVSNNQSFQDHILLKDHEAVKEILTNSIVDEVIFVLPKGYVKEIEEYVTLCEEMGITASLVLDLYKLQRSKTHVGRLGNMPLITFHTVSLNTVQLTLKRIMDILGASLGLLLFGWIILIAIIAIKIESSGPAFFIQERVGTNRRTFKLLKLRSMFIDAEERKKELLKLNEMDGPMFKIKNDPRITKVGKIIRKTSIDELPQFINVLKGDMSLVGTRPPTKEEVDQYDHHQHKRISIKPGITGMWQVSGRNNVKEFEDVVKLDTKYIDQWSIFMDIKIILKTIMVVFANKGAC